MRGRWRSFIAGAGLSTAAAAALMVSSWFSGYGPEEPVIARCSAAAGAIPAGREIKVLVWNIQFSGGRSGEFFYDGGTKVRSSEQEVAKTLAAIVSTIREHNPDIIVLQEVDRNSRRSNHIDQLRELLARTDYPCHVSTPYHRVGYVPHPAHEHLGQVDMHLSVLSRFRLSGGTRHQLALLNEPRWRQMFNLRRALLEVRIPLADGRELAVLNTHLSAFSKGDGTLGRQIQQIQERLLRLDDSGIPWVLAGDFNTLHPGDDRSRLPSDDQIWYAENDSPIRALFERFTPAVSLDQLERTPSRWYTYAPFGTDRPDRVLDYVFHSAEVKPHSLVVDQDHAHTSDHMPLIFRFQL